jgi:hypothetical protein
MARYLGHYRPVTWDLAAQRLSVPTRFVRNKDPDSESYASFLFDEIKAEDKDRKPNGKSPLRLRLKQHKRQAYAVKGAKSCSNSPKAVPGRKRAFLR